MKTKSPNKFFSSFFIFFALAITAGTVVAQTQDPDLNPSSTSESTTPAPSSGSSTAALGGVYQANYERGNAPFKEKTKVTITKSAESFTFVPTSGEAWNIHFKDVRGATATATGIWFYWHEPSGNLLNAYFKMDLNQSALESDINTSVKNYNLRPRIQEEEYQKRQKEYEEQAIKQAQ